MRRAAHAWCDVYDWGKDYLDIERVNACGPPTPRRRAISVRRWLICMMPVPNISAPLRLDTTAPAISGRCRIPSRWIPARGIDPTSYFADGRLRPMVDLGVRRGELD